ncbi:MAG: DNA mismatch repair protein MutH [Candidatus Scalindua rubra]|uniref:DNA mismatch repair protein MutH n=1 Tax=Candidatus Scalindua rubra TaxID=1872076 RepID=A0A1E3X2U2_9BACT|nr:MAG: DNA mismatch repair protein MutH [Candidatus Scalindua rubra]
MERQEAVKKILEIVGLDLRELASTYDVTVFKNGKKNKGWVGHVIERHLNLPINSSQSPNFGSWELKTISLKYLRSGKLTVKETMAITMIDEYNVSKTPFEESHLLLKLKKAVIAARIWYNKEETQSELYGVTTFDLDNPSIFQQIKDDYKLARDTINKRGFEALTGKMGVFIQPRTKGAGHGSTSRAFYARTSFLKQVIFPELYNE